MIIEGSSEERQLSMYKITKKFENQPFSFSKMQKYTLCCKNEATRLRKIFDFIYKSAYFIQNIAKILAR